MVGEEILIEIDDTLDRLIQNAEAIANADLQELSLAELEAFQKTQESLVQHLIHVDQRYETQKKSFKLDRRSSRFQIQAKRERFEKLKSSYHQSVSDKIEKKVPILSKRRKKRFLIGA